MTRDDEVFADALALPPQERPAFLARVCAYDAALHARVEAVLRGLEEAGEFLATPPAPRRAAIPQQKPGDRIGRYRLLQKIGEGGCGVVWLAAQEEPVRRHVALKVIKLGMDTSAVIARFEAERQALALMDHPHIAQVFDAGATETGRPYFVMELVRGTPITHYCDERQLSPGQRIGLFIQVCHAVQHAHQKGIIHRDLKPSNILVTELDVTDPPLVHVRAEPEAAPRPARGTGARPVPKVIDFGVAKATQGRLTDQTLFTAFEQFVGTPAYMSPEQADPGGTDIDTRSDIYSLGVLLYELLAGRTPFDPEALAQAGVDEIRRRLRTVDPPRPSTRLNTLTGSDRAAIAQRRKTAPAQLATLLRGDLDRIVMCCLEKDRGRRYATTSALAQDLERHLRHEPVAARPVRATYVLHRFIRRHRVGFAFAAALAVLCALGTSVSLWQAVRATRAEREQSRLRAAAETQELTARRRAYAADMNLLQQALALDNLGHAKKLLERQRPNPGERDLRGWEWRYLWQRCRSDAAAVLTETGEQVVSLSVSPDGNTLAVGRESGQLSLWDLRTRQETQERVGIVAVRAEYAPRGPLLAIGSTTTRFPRQEDRLQLWNAATRQIVREWPLPSQCTGLFFSADGETMVATTNRPRDNAAEITRWRVADGAQLGPPLAGGAGAVTADLRLAARRSTDGRLQAIDLATGEERWSAAPPAEDESYSELAFSPDAKLLAAGVTGIAGPSIRLWDAATGADLGRLEGEGHRTRVNRLLFWPHGRMLASAGTDQTIRLWDMNARRLSRTLRGHKGEVVALALLPDNRTLVSGSKDGAVYVWDTSARAGGALVQVPGTVSDWRVAADSQSALTIDSGGPVVRWLGRNFDRRDELMNLGPSEGDPTIPAFRRGGRLGRNGGDLPLVAAERNGGVVRVWDWERRALVREIQTPAESAFLVGFREGGKKALLGYRGSDEALRGLHEWDLSTGLKTRSWRSTGLYDSQYVLAPDGARCLIRNENRKTAMVDLVTGAVQATSVLIQQGAPSCFSPDGRFIAVPSPIGEAVIWDAWTLQRVTTLDGFILGVHSTAYSPDGRRLATGSSGIEAIRLWDAESYEPLLTLKAPGRLLVRSEFSADGNVLGAMSAAGELFLWRAPSWAEIEAAEVLAAPKP